MEGMGSDRELLEWAGRNLWSSGEEGKFPNVIPEGLERTSKKKSSKKTDSSSLSPSFLRPDAHLQKKTQRKPSPSNQQPTRTSS